MSANYWIHADLNAWKESVKLEKSFNDTEALTYILEVVEEQIENYPEPGDPIIQEYTDTKIEIIEILGE
jgi:hypothetical protein